MTLFEEARYKAVQQVYSTGIIRKLPIINLYMRVGIFFLDFSEKPHHFIESVSMAQSFLSDPIKLRHDIHGRLYEKAVNYLLETPDGIFKDLLIQGD